ncbi:MAG TPA: aminotransferase class I/II-fold pyridoxal phosphate-dependent enzyme [Vicinamibacterales bacterium]|nr:aminotransferase class I/II-fold pyridoxal phosphate-dependent enzyme [Vicinamibacterales bacterium]
MNVRQFSRRHFVGGMAAAVGAIGLRPDAQPLLAQGQTPQFAGSDADYDNFVKLASNENNWGPPDSVMKAMNSAWKYANRYGYPDGNVVQVIADHHGVRRDNILLTAGSGEGLNVMATTYLGPGKKVLGVSPSYASVFQQAANVKADSIQLPLTKDYRQDIGQMIEAANRNARDIGFVYMCNPNNPTGAVVTAKEIKDLLDNIPKDMPVLIDEAYHHYVDDPAYGTAIPYVLEGRKVVVARTFSKIAALAAMRIGYSVAPPDMIREMRVYASNSVNVLAKWGAVASLKDPAAQADVKQKTITLRNNTSKVLESWGYPVIPSQTNFFMVHLGDRTVQPVIEEFRKRGILVGRPFPPMLNHLRVSVGTPEDMEKFIQAFKAIFPQKSAATARG